MTRRVRPFAQPDAVVAILLPRTSVEAFAAPIGVLRAGAAYTSIDVSFPDERIRDLIEDVAAVAVVTDGPGAERLVRLGLDSGRIVSIDIHPNGATPEDDTPAGQDAGAPPWLTPASLAYVIYTSGTTGRPKGVMVEHAAIANLVRSDLGEFTVTAGDRVGQSSSHAYDSSIEEIWLAFASGATLVVLDDDIARAGPDLVPWLERETITVLCPPPTLLRATGRRDARGLLPRLRLLYVGGEALTDDVVEVWAPGRRLVNGYGPTEAAVTAVRTDVVLGAAVAIGRPIPNATARVVTESLEEVADGETGELWLGGAGLARGYWNDAGLTARKFPVHPAYGRMYLTGDLARRAPDGTLFCLGRADTQVKIRGYRIELEEIEARLAACIGVREAACRVQGGASRPTLVAFVVAADPASPPDPECLRRDLAVALPAYMVPSRVAVVEALATTTGGKLDRTALPALDLEPVGTPASARPRTRMESRIEAALRRVADLTAPIPVTAHFFEDLGGDSLLAAELITALRAHPETAALTVRDAYDAPTIERLAGHAERSAGTTPAVQRDLPDPGGRPGLATLIQMAWLTIEVVVASALGYLAAIALWSWIAPLATPGRIALWLPVLGAGAILLYLPLSVGAVVLAKRLVVGRYRPGKSPVWGRFHVRHWAVCQLLRIVPWPLLEGTVFQLAVLRALGARIGRRVHIHRGVDLLQGGWDLLEIGDDVTIGQEATIRLVDLEDEQLVVGPVSIGAGATLETRASVAGHATIEPGGYLTALSSLPAGASIPAGQRWDGVPAAAAGSAPDAPALAPGERVLPPAVHGAVMLVSRILSGLLMPTIAGVVFAWHAASLGVEVKAIAAWLRAPFWRWDVLGLAATVGVLLVPIAVAVHVVAIRLLGQVTPGVISRWSPAYLRVWITTDLVRRAGDWLSGTLMWPHWLRAAGMRIGKDCEISTIIDVVPGLVAIGPSTFFADGVYLGGPRLHRGTVALAPTRLGSGVFLGNHVAIPAGCVVPDEVLIGVSTVANDASMRAGSSWFGHPPFALSRPPAAPVDRRLTHDPSLVRYVNRWLWELGRFLIPIASVLLLLGFAHLLLRARTEVPLAWMALVVTPALVVGMGAALAAAVLALKWLLLGRVRPGRHALWSCWCSRWDFHYVAWGRLARPFLARFEGTLLLAWYLRAMGMRIGRRVVLGPGFAQVVDPDMIRLDDGATVHALFQAHTFEDRMLKIDRIRIRRRATVGCGAVLFYGADVGEGASVAAQSVIMKHERLSPRQRYEGCPSAGVSNSS